MKGTKMAAAMTLLVVLSCSFTVYSAPVVNDVTSEDFPLERECVYQLRRYAHASTVETEEPCLNCTCNRGVLVCFLRVCHNIVAPPTSNCTVVKPAGKCCSQLLCGERKNELETEVTPTKSTKVTLGVTESGENVLIEKSGVLVTEEDPGTTISSDNTEDYGDQWSSSLAPTSFDELVKTGCEQNGSIYAEGSAMPSETFCDYCYCIRGFQRCIQPQCHLQIDECQPIYRHHFSCCPTAYKCSKFQPEVSSTTTLPPSHKGCDVNGTFYQEGEAVVSEDICQNCFCVNGQVQCSVTRCAMQLNQCRPIVQPGKCCPTGYNCSYVNIVEDSEVTTTEDETVAQSRLTADDIELANGTAEYSNQTEEATTELLQHESSTPPSDVTNEIDDGRTTENTFSVEERSDNNDIASTEVNIEGPTMADDVLQGRLVGTTDSGVESDGNTTDNGSTVSEADIDHSSVEFGNETDSEVSTYWPDYEETNLDEKFANVSSNNQTISNADIENNTTIITIVPEILQVKHENRSSPIEYQNETNNQITYRTSSGNHSDHLHNITVQLVENVAGQLLKDKLTINKHVDGNNNFRNWTHLENETDLLQISNVDQPVIESIASAAINESNDHVPASSANLHGSLHSIVSSLLAKPDITTEGSKNYSDLFDDLVGEAPGEFHFNPIVYFNFSDGQPNQLSTPSSYRQDFYPTSTKSNEILQTLTDRIDHFTSTPNELLDHPNDHHKSNVTMMTSEPSDNAETNLTSISDNESESDHQFSSITDKNSSTISADSLISHSNLTIDPLQYSGILLNNQSIDSDLKNESINISDDSIDNQSADETSNSSTNIENGSKIDNVFIDNNNLNITNDKLTTPLAKLHPEVTTTSEPDDSQADQLQLATPKTETVGINTTEAIGHHSGGELNDSTVHHSDVGPNGTVVHFEDETHPDDAETTPSSFSESDLEDTIEMILNLSKTLAASNKRPTQWHPSENNSATDLLSGTLPADVEAKLTEIIRMAQAGLIPTEEPFPTHHLNVSFNFEKTTSTIPPEEGDQYYNEYYDDEAKETVSPSLLDEPTVTNSSVTNNAEDTFQKDLQDVLHPLSTNSSQLSSTEELRTDDETPHLVQLTTVTPNDGPSHGTTEKHPTTPSFDYFVQPEVDHQYTFSENFNNSATEPGSPSHLDQLSDNFDVPQPEIDTYDRPAYDEQPFNHEKFPEGLSESVVAEQDDQIGAGSIVHQDEQPVGGEAGALFDEPPEEQGPAQTNDDDGQHFDGLIGAPNDEEKSYFSSDDNFDNRPNDQTFENEQPADNVFEPPTPTEPVVHVDHTKPNVDTTPITYNNFNTEHFPELQPELVKEFIESIKFGSSDVESRQTTKHQPEVTTHQPSTELTSDHPTSQPSNKLIDYFDDFNNFDKSESQVHDQQVTLSERPLQTEAVTSEANKPFVGLVTKGSIQFDHVLPLSRRGRPTTDEKTGQALPTPRKSNSSIAVDSVSHSVDEDTPAVIPFLPEDAITDEHLLKEPLFGGGGDQTSFERPVIIERNDQNINNRSDFAVHVSASTAINVHDPNTAELEPLLPDVKAEGVAIPESHDYADEIPVESPAILNTTPSVNHTDGPLVIETTEETKVQTAQPALPKFDDHREQSPSALGLQQTPEYCVENGEVFQDGERIPTHDFCAQCRCVKGEIQCQHLSCPLKPKGCIEKIVPSSCCPAFVCNETENGDVPIRSGITIHSGFTPIDRPVVPPDHQPPKASVVNSADLGFESEDAAVDHSRPELTTISVAIESKTSTKPPTTDEDQGIFGSLLEAVFGHGFDNGNRTLLDSISDISEVEPERVTEEIVEQPSETTLRTTTTTTTRPTTVTRKRSSTTTTPPSTTTTTAKEPNVMMWPMLKVSGCNIYGRVYQVGATIGVLSGPCKECKCTNRGVDCYKVKCF